MYFGGMQMVSCECPECGFIGKPDYNEKDGYFCPECEYTWGHLTNILFKRDD